MEAIVDVAAAPEPETITAVLAKSLGKKVTIRGQYQQHSMAVEERPAISNASSCVFKVPPSLMKMNRKYFDPHVVSIGPIHREYENNCLILEEHKARYFESLVRRSRIPKKDYLEAVKARSAEIKSCYDGCCLWLGDLPDDCIEKIVTDGCFIIEMFRMVKGLVPESIKTDPILNNMAQLFSFVQRDLMLLENQIPFFVLQLLFDKSKTCIDCDHTLIELALNFFNYASPKVLEFGSLTSCCGKVKHLLDLLRLSVIKHAPKEQGRRVLDWSDTCIPREQDGRVLDWSDTCIPREQDRRVLDWSDACIPSIPSASKLRRGGISIKRILHGKNLIDIGFDGRKGCLKIPPLILDDFVSSFLANCVAFEAIGVDSTTHFSTYVTFMKYYINEEKDVSDDTKNFFNNLAGGSPVDVQKSYLADVFYEVNKCYKNKYFWKKYFNSRWSSMSALVVSVGLLWTAIQAHYAISPKKLIADFLC